MTSEVVGPCSPDGRWQDELVEELAQSICVDVVADVVLRAVTEDLLVDASTVRAVVQVVGDRRATQADMEREFDLPACLGNG